MLHKFFNSFDPDSKADPLFGSVELHHNEADNTYYLMKDITLSNYPEKLSLTIESTSQEADKAQFELFQEIEANFNQLIEQANQFMETHPDLPVKNFEAEAIYIGPQKNTKLWELSLLNTSDGSSYCIIEWQGLKPVGLSVEE